MIWWHSNDLVVDLITNYKHYNKLASLGATLVRNYDSLTYLLTGVKCRATSVAKNINIALAWKIYHGWSLMYLCCVVCGRRIYPSGKLANGRFIGPYIKLWGEVGEGGVHYKSTNTCGGWSWCRCSQRLRNIQEHSGRKCLGVCFSPKIWPYHCLSFSFDEMFSPTYFCRLNKC